MASFLSGPVGAWLAVFLGGGLGGALRYAVSGWVGRRVGETFPWGTLVVNASGAFAIGLLLGLLLSGHAFAGGLWLPLGVGVLGGYTTVSSLSLQTLLLSRDGGHGRAAAYLGLSLLTGLVAVLAGIGAGR